MKKIEYGLPIFEDDDISDLNEYSNQVANAMKAQIDKFGNPIVFKGSVETLEELEELEKVESGYIYAVISENKNYIYNGSEWVKYSDISSGTSETSGQGIPTNAVIEYEGDTVPEGYEEVGSSDEIIVSPTEPTTGEKVWIQKGKNLFDKNNAVSEWISGDGGIGSSDVSMRTGKMKIKANTNYIFSYDYETLVVENNREYCLYDNDLNVLTVTPTYYEVSDKQFIINSSVDGYIDICYDPNFTNVMFTQNTVATDYEEYIEPKMYVKTDNGVYEEFIRREEEIYSLEEQKIGTWIDGKTLYRKVVSYTNADTIGALESLKTVNIPHNISDLENIVDVSGYTSMGNILPILNGSTVPNQSVNIAFVNATDIQLRLLNITISARTWYFILEYTKTTD